MSHRQVRIRWRRPGQEYWQARVFSQRPPASRLIQRLVKNNWRTEFSVEERSVGPWEKSTGFDWQIERARKSLRRL